MMDLSSVLTDMTHESAILYRRQESTISSIREELLLMKNACERMDILNLRLGPYSATVLAKVDVCRKILEINGDQLSKAKVEQAQNLLNEIVKVINKKMSYGKRLDSFLEKKESDIIEVIKSNLLESDLDQYAKIQKKLVSFRTKSLKLTESLLEMFKR